MEKIISKFNKIIIGKNNKNYSPHKPILILISLHKCFYGKDRLVKFSEYEELFELISNAFDIKIILQYPFIRLVSDGIWEVENFNNLLKNKSGDVSRKILIDLEIRGGFTHQLYKFLFENKNTLLLIYENVLTKFFEKEKQSIISNILKFPAYCISKNYLEKDIKIREVSMSYAEEVNPRKINNNGFISYLNSLHNIQASGANALAESQVLNPYFLELYKPFPLVDIVFNALIDDVPRVIVLTGHAGDGKSTIAFDVLKKLRSLASDKALDTAINEREDIPHASGPVSIIKDMSELTAAQRLIWLGQAFNEVGCWLIVSNTGPLLNSLNEYAKLINKDDYLESEILELLNQPYEGGSLDRYTLPGFSKELVVLNMARLDNVNLGASLLTRMLEHSAWDECDGCEAKSICPLRQNREALQQAGEIVEDRIRWVYQRITAYEQRLTLRQMVGHLALSLTGGMSCATIRSNNLDSGVDGLEEILFSENFFGCRRGVPWIEAEELRVIKLIRNLVFGGPIAPNFERLFFTPQVDSWIAMPTALLDIQTKWNIGARDSTGIRWRFALRRMIYFFAYTVNKNKILESVFIDTFLQSAKLRSLDKWQQECSFQSSTTSEQNKLKKECLQVLLETYSGFSAGQFDSHQGRLYLTLRRPDRTVVQPTQLVVAELDYYDFSIEYDSERRIPFLRFKPNKTDLLLTLPLLDYINARSIGNFGNSLAPIHLAQLEIFRASLLIFFNNRGYIDGEIDLLCAEIDGSVKLHRYFLDENNNNLELR